MSTETASDPRVGTILEGNYRIERVIGSGGMSTVYEATQLRLGKRMAIKVLAAHMTANERVMARFHREAEITSKLGHPNLISVVDRGRTETGEPYLVMEYLEGEDLDQRLARVGRMPIADVVGVVMQIASGLSAAHAQGAVHRDLKPANLFLVRMAGEPDFVKVLDFGVSKLIAAHTRLTKQATAVGTPFYMAPEQAAGMVDSIDHRIDQWALACIAWEMLVGERPFVGATPMEVLHQIVTTEPAPLTPQVPGLPLAVEPVLRKALCKRASGRYDSIREFSHAFASAALGQPIELTPAPAPPSPALDGLAHVDRRSHVKRAMVLAAMAAALGLSGVVGWLRPRAVAPLPKAAQGPIITPLLDPPVPPSPDARMAEPVSPEATPARVKRAKPVQKARAPVPRSYGKHPLFDKL